MACRGTFDLQRVAAVDCFQRLKLSLLPLRSSDRLRRLLCFPGRGREGSVFRTPGRWPLVLVSPPACLDSLQQRIDVCVLLDALLAYSDLPTICLRLGIV